MFPSFSSVRAGTGVCAASAFPERSARFHSGRESKQGQRDARLQPEGHAGSRDSSRPRGKRQRHQIRADGNADAVEGLHVVEVGSLVVKRHVVVEGGVHRARAEAERHGTQKQPEKTVGEGKAENAHGGHRRAGQRHLRGAKAADDLCGVETGEDRPHGDDHRDKARPAHRHAKVRVDGRPRRPKERVRHAHPHKRDVDHHQQKCRHTRRLLRGMLTRAARADIMIASPFGKEKPQTSPNIERTYHSGETHATKDAAARGRPARGGLLQQPFPPHVHLHRPFRRIPAPGMALPLAR